MRRSILIGLGIGFRIVGSRYSPDTRRLRDFAIRNRLPHHWVDLESDPGAEEILRRLGVTPEECPIVLLGPGDVLRNPSNAELARALGLRPPSASETTCDLIVVGGGPAGLAAGGVRRLGGPLDGRAGSARDRRPGRNLVEDRELPRLPSGDLRRRARRARDDPGAEVRCPDHRTG